jgi:chemotaxis protein methyltransferase CheR
MLENCLNGEFKLREGPLRATANEFLKFQKYIQNNIGLKFPESKKSLLESRLSSHISKLGFNSFGDYFDYIESQPELSDEVDFLVDKLTTHTTSFFREIYHFDFLTTKGIQHLLQSFGNRTVFKILSLGSSTGEEMYTLAMLFATFKKKRIIHDYIIDGADISKYALLKAKEGIFKLDHFDSIPPEYKDYFEVRDEKLYAKNILKQNLRFFILNACNNGQRFPDTYHVVFCRNTLIYFPKELQQNVIDNIQKIIIPGGIFIMGHSESLYGLKHEFTRMEPTIYKSESLK